MTLNRPRLMALSLCALLVSIVVLLAIASNNPGRQVAMRDHPSVSFMPADAAPARNYDVADTSASVVPREVRREAGPNVVPAAAPGVAFSYGYAFRLAAPRIAEVQERHARLCERLTLARCRIAGMRYRVVNDRDIEAMLALGVDPASARSPGSPSASTAAGSPGRRWRARPVELAEI